LFTALWIPDNFMRAVKNNGDWYLFCPNDIKKAGLKALQESYGDEYEQTYNQAVQMGLGKKVQLKQFGLK
jgi:ribonucleoside-diphosphate reductase subunit M1